MSKTLGSVALTTMWLVLGSGLVGGCSDPDDSYKKEDEFLQACQAACDAKAQGEGCADEQANGQFAEQCYSACSPDGAPTASDECLKYKKALFDCESQVAWKCVKGSTEGDVMRVRVNTEDCRNLENEVTKRCF